MHCNNMHPGKEADFLIQSTLVYLDHFAVVNIEYVLDQKFLSINTRWYSNEREKINSYLCARATITERIKK